MDLTSSQKIIDITTKKYIDGKSFDTLVKFLTINGYNSDEAIIELKFLHEKFHVQRINRANKDLLIALIFISIPLIELLIYLLGLFPIKIGIVEFCCLFAWRPFMLSYYRVIKEKKKFELL